MIHSALWPPHWGFVLASYGLVITVLAIMITTSLLRLRRASQRLTLMQRLQDTAANPATGQEKD